MGTDHDMDGVASDFHAFLQNFFVELPQYRGCKLVITGESYAGHYVPAVSYHIWAANKGIVADDEKINFVGKAIGNGLTDPAEQYKHYPQMARDGGKSVGGSLAEGVITNPAECGVMEAAAEPCSLSCKACDDVGGVACTAAFIACNYAETVPYQLTGMNVYDMRIKCASPPLCYDFSNVGKFLLLQVWLQTRIVCHWVREELCNGGTGRFVQKCQCDFAHCTFQQKLLLR